MKRRRTRPGIRKVRGRPEPPRDQRPGEEPVQVNDAYQGGAPPPAPDEDRPGHDEQHATGG